MRAALETSRAEILDRYPDALELSVERLREIRDEVASESARQGCSHGEIRLHAFLRTLEEIGEPNPEFARELTHRYLDFRFARAVLYPEVEPILRRLSSYFPLGLVSNGNSDPERCGLPNLFACQIFSTQCGVAKPNPKIFQIAKQELDCSPRQLLHIGDSLPNDIACPQTLGINTVWLNRSAEPTPDSCHPDFMIDSLGGLPSLLGISLDPVVV